jgi:hypothetical protein
MKKPRTTRASWLLGGSTAETKFLGQTARPAPHDQQWNLNRLCVRTLKRTLGFSNQTAWLTLFTEGAIFKTHNLPPLVLL